MLVNSNMFNVFLERMPRQPQVVRGANCHLIRVNGKTILIDTWDSYSPTSNMINEGYFDHPGFKDVDLIIKIQYYKCPFWDEMSQKIGKPIRPWTMFPNSTWPLSPFKWTYKPHKLMGILTGKNDRFGRQPWVEWCMKQTDFEAGYNLRIEETDFINKLINCRWGLILKGKTHDHDGKNRREVEYSSCGMPLVLTYQPTYDFPMVAGEHYVYLTKPEQLEQLRQIDPRPFAERSAELYHDHFSPQGMAKDLLKLCKYGK